MQIPASPRSVAVSCPAFHASSAPTLTTLLSFPQDVVPDAKAEDDMETDGPNVVEALKYDNLEQVSKLVQTERYQKILKVNRDSAEAMMLP